MIFNIKNPILTDPFLEREDFFQYWNKSKENNTYYVWVQRVTKEIEFSSDIEPTIIDLEQGVKLYIYKGTNKQEILYRIKFSKKKLSRFLLDPFPYVMFWSYGKVGGTSTHIKYLFRDKNISIHKWVDKDSYLAIIRQKVNLIKRVGHV